MKKSFIKILSRLMALAILFSLSATAIGCVKDDPVINSQPPVETTVTLDSEVKNMTVGDSTILNFTFTGEENLQTSWSSSDENVAKVIDGRVEAISEGTTTVTITYGSVTDTCTINVSFGGYLPELINGYGFEDVYNINKDGSLHFSPAIKFRNIVYYDGQFDISVGDTEILQKGDDCSVCAKGVLGSSNVVIVGSWRGIDVSKSPLLRKDVTINVEEDVYVSLESGPIDSFDIYTRDSFEGENYVNTIDFKPVVFVEGKKVDGASIKTEIVDSTIAVIENNKIVGKSFGKTNVYLSYTHNDKVYSKTLMVNVQRPIADFNKKINYFSTFTGTLRDETAKFEEKTVAEFIYGDNVELYDAYQGATKLTIQKDVDCFNNISGVVAETTGTTEITITVGTNTECYNLDVTVYGLYLYEAKDLKSFEITKPSDVNKGYVELARDIDCSGVNIQHFAKSDITGNSDAMYKSSGFNGTFDGKGYVIKNLDLTSSRGMGIFGSVIGNTTIKNVAFENVNCSNGSLFACRIYAGSQSYDFTLQNVYVDVSANTKNAEGIIAFSIEGNSSKPAIIKNVVVNYPTLTEFDDGLAYGQGSFVSNPLNTFYTRTVNESDGTLKKFENNTANFSDNYVLSTFPLAHYASKSNGVTATVGTYNVVAYGENENPAERIEKPATSNGFDTLDGRYKVSGIRRYDDATAMSADKTANNQSLATFDGTYWTVIDGVPYWNGIVYQVTSNIGSFNFNNNIELGINVNGDAVSSVTVELVNSEDAKYVTVDGALVSRKAGFNSRNDAQITLKVTATNGDVTITKYQTVTLIPQSKEVNDLYVESNGAIIGLNDDIKASIANAEYVDGEMIVNVTDFVINDASYFENKELGKYYTLIAFDANDLAYRLNYRYVTKTISKADDLKVFVLESRGALEQDVIGSQGNVLASAGESQGVKDKDGYYVLTNNIDASEYTPNKHEGFFSNDIFPTLNRDYGLTGTFDGQGYTISNLSVVSNGLFGMIDGGTIKNVAFIDCTVATSRYNALFAEKVWDATLENVYVKGTTFSGRKDNGILACNSMDTVTMTNVVVDLTGMEIVQGQYYSALGRVNYDSRTGVWVNTYTIGTTTVCVTETKLQVAKNLSAETITALKKAYKLADDVTVYTVQTGVKSYLSLAEMELDASENKANLDAMVATGYWTANNGVISWKSK